MKEFTATVTLNITAHDHADACKAVTDAVKDYNGKKITGAERGPQRIEISEVSKVKLEREN